MERIRKIKGHGNREYFFKKNEKTVNEVKRNGDGSFKTIEVKNGRVRLNIKGEYKSYSHSDLIEILFEEDSN